MVVVPVAAMIEVDLNKLGEAVGHEVVVVADGDPVEVGVVVDDLGGEGDREVAIIVEPEVVPALRRDAGECNDTPPFMQMILIVACKGCRTTRGRCSLADY